MYMPYVPVKAYTLEGSVIFTVRIGTTVVLAQDEVMYYVCCCLDVPLLFGIPSLHHT